MRTPRILIFLIALVVSTPGLAQRYLADIFSEVAVTADIPYGTAPRADGTADTLRFDFFEPAGDTETARPLFILIHGGSFSRGRRTNESVVTLAEIFARKGYAAASISYRLSDREVFDWDLFQIDTLALFVAAHQAMHDAKAAVRYFRKEAYRFRIDPDHIIIGGLSAGAITAVTAGYTDREEELLPDADPPTVEGNSGNEGYSSDVSTVVSLCGGAIFPDILDSADAPRLFVAHDRGDPVVPFSAAESLYQQAIRIGVPAEAQFFYSPFHCSFANPQYDAIIGSQTPTLVSMMLFLADPLVQVAAARDIPDRGEVSMYPNPVDHTATFTFPAGTGGTMTIYDTMGRRVRTDILDRSGSMVFSRTGLSPGYYLCHFSWEDGRSATAPMILR